MVADVLVVVDADKGDLVAAGMEILQWVHAETIRLAMTSLAVKSPQGRGSDSRNFSSSSRSDSGLVVFGGRKVTICLP